MKLSVKNGRMGSLRPALTSEQDTSHLEGIQISSRQNMKMDNCSAGLYESILGAVCHWLNVTATCSY